MKKLVYIAIFFFSSSCTNNDSARPLESFKNIEGLLYYEKPETGSMLDIIFMPAGHKRITAENMGEGSNNMDVGIKFGTTNGNIKDALYTYYSQKAILKNGIDREVFLVPNAKLYFHVEAPVFTYNSAIEKNVRRDTLIYKGESIILKYRYSYLSIDSIKVRNATYKIGWK